MNVDTEKLLAAFPDLDRTALAAMSPADQAATIIRMGQVAMMVINEALGEPLHATIALGLYAKALAKVMLELLKDDTEVYKQFVQNPSFKRFVTDMVFGLTSGSATPTTDKRPSSRPPGGKRLALDERLAQSADPRDRLGSVLLGLLEKTRRITLGDAIRAAEKLALGDDDALAAVERLARSETASIQRFYVDRSGAQPRIVSADEVRERSTKSTDGRHEWASVIEVVWAASEADAIAGGAA